MNPFEVGEGVAETIEAVALCLSQCWLTQVYKSKRSKDGILDQEVDKISLLLIDSWARSDLKKFVPFAVVPGRHGPGPALRGAGNKHVYICDIIETFQRS